MVTAAVDAVLSMDMKFAMGVGAEYTDPAMPDTYYAAGWARTLYVTSSFYIGKTAQRDNPAQLFTSSVTAYRGCSTLPYSWIKGFRMAIKAQQISS